MKVTRSQPEQGFPPVDRVGASRQLPRAEFFRALRRGDWAPYHTVDDLGPADYTVDLEIQVRPWFQSYFYDVCYFRLGGPVQDEDGGGLRDIPGVSAEDVEKEILDRLWIITRAGDDESTCLLVTITRRRNENPVSEEKVLYIG